MRIPTKLAALAGAVAAASLVLSGCAGDAGSTGAGGGDSSKPETVVPGTLTVGLSPDFPPMEYLDGETLLGVDVEITKELGARLGLEIAYEQQTFDQLINSIRTQRVDVVFSGMSDTVERQKTLEIVDYFRSEGRFYTMPGGEGAFAQSADVCGAAVAVSSKTDYYGALQKFSADVCEAAGLPAVNIVPTDSGAAARLQLEQGRAQLAVQGGENLAYFNAKEPGKYVVVLDALTKTPFGASVEKGNTALAEAIRQALQEMVDDGTMQRILDAHDLGYGLMDPVINGVTA